MVAEAGSRKRGRRQAQLLARNVVLSHLAHVREMKVQWRMILMQCKYIRAKWVCVVFAFLLSSLYFFRDGENTRWLNYQQHKQDIVDLSPVNFFSSYDDVQSAEDPQYKVEVTRGLKDRSAKYVAVTDKDRSTTKSFVVYPNDDGSIFVSLLYDVNPPVFHWPYLVLPCMLGFVAAFIVYLLLTVL